MVVVVEGWTGCWVDDEVVGATAEEGAAVVVAAEDCWVVGAAELGAAVVVCAELSAADEGASVEVGEGDVVVGEGDWEVVAGCAVVVGAAEDSAADGTMISYAQRGSKRWAFTDRPMTLRRWSSLLLRCPRREM